MVTLRLDFHMGRVECVTCHVPESQSVVGGVQAGWGRFEVVGGRKESDWAIRTNRAAGPFAYAEAAIDQ